MKRELSIAKVLVVVSMLLALAVGIGKPNIGMAALSGSTFNAGDGNLVITGNETDWASFSDGAVRKADQPSGQQDDSFGQGTKEDTEVPTVVNGSIPPNKSDLTNFYAASESTASTTFMYLGWSRVQDPSGTTNMDFELNQSSTLSSNGVTPVRTAGDVLIKYDLSQGGVNPVLGYHIWVTTGNPSQLCEASNSLPCWGKVHPISGGAFEASINTAAVDNLRGGSYSARTFGEAAIDMVAAGIFTPGQCVSFGSAYLKSRSSDSFTAAIKDFVAPKAISVQNCGTIIIRKQTFPAGGTGFGYTTTGGLDPSTFSLDDGGSKTYSNQLAGAYSVTESDPGPNYALGSITCSVSGGTGSTYTVDLQNRKVSINLSALETVDCTFTNNLLVGSISIHKVDDANANLAGAVFTLYKDNAPVGGTRGNEDTITTYTCTTNASGNCSISNVLQGNYWVVETTTPAGYTTAAEQAVTVTAGQTLPLTFTDPRKFKVIVLVCKESGNTLYPSTVTVDGVNKTSLAPGGGGTITDASLCGLGGASYDNKAVGNHPANVNIPLTPVP